MRNEARGFSLIEVIVIVAIISLLASAIAPLAFQSINAERERETYEELDAIQRAIYGNPNLGTHGYLGDVGQLPPDIGALLVRPDTVAASSAGSNGVPIGWAGPYLLSGTARPTLDGWGTAYAMAADATGGLTGHVRSAGPDRAFASGDDLVVPGGPTAGGGGAAPVRLAGGVTVSVFALLGGWPVQVPAADIDTLRVFYPQGGAETWTGFSGAASQNEAGCAGGATPGWTVAPSGVGAAYTLITCNAGIPFGTRAIQVKTKTIAGSAWSNQGAWKTVFHGAALTTVNVYLNPAAAPLPPVADAGQQLSNSSRTVTVPKRVVNPDICRIFAVAIGGVTIVPNPPGAWTITTDSAGRIVNWMQVCSGF